MQTIERTARKDHECTLCNRRIAKGTSYMHATITPWDHAENDGFDVYKAHPMCDSMWHQYGEDYDWIFPDAREFIDEVLTIENL